MGCDARMDEKERIQEFNDRLAEVGVKAREVMGRLYEKRQAKLPSVPIEQPVSDHFNIYVYPQELGKGDEDLQFECSHHWEFTSITRPLIGAL